MLFATATLLALAAAPAHLGTLPRLNDPVPSAVRQAQAAGRTCDVGERHRDPCSTISIHRDRVTVAWDAATRRVTYLYTTTIATDTEMVTGGVGRIDASMDIMPFGAGFVSPDWCDTDTELSGDALWCAVMKPAPRHHGKVLGFVQSIYLLLPDVDAPLLHRASLRPPL